MFIDVNLSRLMIIKDSANTSTANPGQQEDFIALTLDSFQNSLLQENNNTPQRLLCKQIRNDELTSILIFIVLRVMRAVHAKSILAA
jgi:hypothetical protein